MRGSRDREWRDRVATSSSPLPTARMADPAFPLLPTKTLTLAPAPRPSSPRPGPPPSTIASAGRRGLCGSTSGGLRLSREL